MASVLKSGYSSGGRALASGARGRAFESRYPDHTVNEQKRKLENQRFSIFSCCLRQLNIVLLLNNRKEFKQ